MDQKKIRWIAGSIAGVVIVAAIVYFFLQQNSKIAELEGQSEIDKIELEQQYQELAIQYEGVNRLTVKNDSLVYQLDSEKVKVQRLLEELKQVKATDARKINGLRKELETLRGVMRTFVRQIDSLNRENDQLKRENSQVRNDLSRVSQQASSLAKEREQLEEKVIQAALLDAINIRCILLDKRSKPTKKVKNVTCFEIRFDIAKNITTKVGERVVYAMITKPDGMVLTKNRSDEFTYQNKQLNYSCKKVIQYEGEQVDVVLYWNVEEYLSEGTYNLDIFAEGNHIGRTSFSIGK